MGSIFSVHWYRASRCPRPQADDRSMQGTELPVAVAGDDHMLLSAMRAAQRHSGGVTGSSAG
jgi:hypothetical protein